ncbi:MAG TPA: PilZ domain-containing protein [Candidatus Acidoferrales bacterium]|nr:PilZ domain-containing protein [Candidatus Acidoferrales bacterium]
MSKKPAKSGERRSANRYAVVMRMEIWPEFDERGPGTTFVNTRDVSIQGVYFVSDIEHHVGARLNFSVLFVHKPSGREGDLISGLGRIVRCEPLVSIKEPHFGVAMEIEKTTHLHTG